MNRTGLIFAAAMAFSAAHVGRCDEALIPFTAFLPSQSGFAYGTSDISLTPGTGSFSYRGSVALPAGSTITQVQLLCDDSSAAQDISCLLYRFSGSGAFVIAPAIASSGSSGFQTVSSPVLSVPVSGTSVYTARVTGVAEAGGTISLRSVRIIYTPPAAAATCPGDVNGDNTVNGADLSVLLATFGNVCTP